MHMCTLSLHDALPIYLDFGQRDHRSTSPNTMSSDPSTALTSASMWPRHMKSMAWRCANPGDGLHVPRPHAGRCEDRKSTRLNSSHANISYAVFCSKQK